MKTNRGITLMETLISILIAGIVGVCLLMILANKSRIDVKTLANYNVAENVKSDFEMFTYDPISYKSYYSLASNVEKRINYDSKFDKVVNSESANYLIVKFIDKEDNHGYYQLTIKIYINNKLRKFDNVDYLSRSVYAN